MNGFLTNEELYTRAVQEAGWFNETRLEGLAANFIEDLLAEIKVEERRLVESDNMVGELEYCVDGLEQQVRDLEYELEAERDRDDSDEVEELKDEVAFLKTLVADLEEELATIDSEQGGN